MESMNLPVNSKRSTLKTDVTSTIFTFHDGSATGRLAVRDEVGTGRIKSIHDLPIISRCSDSDGENNKLDDGLHCD